MFVKLISNDFVYVVCHLVTCMRYSNVCFLSRNGWAYSSTHTHIHMHPHREATCLDVPDAWLKRVYICWGRDPVTSDDLATFFIQKHFLFRKHADKSLNHTKMFEEVPEKISFPEEEEKVLALWKKIDAFQTSLKQSRNRPRLVYIEVDKLLSESVWMW